MRRWRRDTGPSSSPDMSLERRPADPTSTDGLADFLPLTLERVQQWRDDELLRSGVQLYVSLAGATVADLALGEARPGVAMTPRSICKQYCTIKPLTAVAIAQLASAGQIGLDQPVSYFIPAFARQSKDRITLRHILTHTAGLFDAPSFPYPESHDELIAFICNAKVPPGWAPGSKAVYSRLFGWQLLAEIIRIVTGSDFSPYLRENVLLPLGMHDTWVGMSPEQFLSIEKRLAVNYVSYEKEPNLLTAPGSDGPPCDAWDKTADWGPFWFELTEESCTQVLPAFGGYSPARDLGRFYEALLGSNALPTVSQDVLDEFTSAQRSGLYDSVLGRICDYGLGFMVNLRDHFFGDYCSANSFGHSGFSGSSLAFADKDKGLVVSLLFNDVLDWETAFLRRRAIINGIYEDLGLRVDAGNHQFMSRE